MMQRAEELDYHASDMYNDDDDSWLPPVEVDEYEPVEYQVATREPSIAGANLRRRRIRRGRAAELARGLKLHGVHELVTDVHRRRRHAPALGVRPNKPLVSCVLLVCAPGWITPARPQPRSSRRTSRSASERASRRGSITPPRRRVTSSRRCSSPCPRGRRGAAAGRRREIEGKRRRRERRRSAASRAGDAKGPYGSTDARDLLRRIGDGPFPPEHYLLSAADMAEMEHPIPTLVPTPTRPATTTNAGGRRRRGAGRKRRRDDAGHEGSTSRALALPEGYVVTQPAGGGWRVIPR